MSRVVFNKTRSAPESVLKCVLQTDTAGTRKVKGRTPRRGTKRRLKRVVFFDEVTPHTVDFILEWHVNDRLEINARTPANVLAWYRKYGRLAAKTQVPDFAGVSFKLVPGRPEQIKVSLTTARPIPAGDIHAYADIVASPEFPATDSLALVSGTIIGGVSAAIRKLPREC